MNNYRKRFNRSMISTLIATSLFCGEGEGDGDGDGGGEGGGQSGVDVNSQAFKDAVAAATQGISGEADVRLKNKNTELLAKLTKANENAKQFEGMDVEKIKRMTAMFEKDEEMKLIAEGKIDEVIQKRTDALTAASHDRITNLENELESSTKSATEYKTKYDQNTIRQELTKAALNAKVRSDAIEDVVRRGFDMFSINDAGEIESRGPDGELRQTADNLILNPERFIESLKEVTPYYWGQSESGMTNGSKDMIGGKHADSLVISAAQGNNGQIDMAQYRKSRQKQSGDDYHQRNR